MKGPVGIGIAAVAAGAFLIYKNWDRISPLLGKTAARFESFWNTVQPQLQPFLGSMYRNRLLSGERIYKSCTICILRRIGCDCNIL